MRTMIRPALAATALLLLIAAPVAAGGWAVIEPDEAARTAEPRAGEFVDIGFTVLQHGMTPAPWEQPTVVARNALTGEQITAAATSTGPDGHFAATLTFPEAGLWTWTVELRDLVAQSPTTAVGVLAADGTAPALDPATVFAVVREATERVRAEVASEYGERLTALERQVETQAQSSRTLAADLQRARAARDELAARVEELGRPEAGVPALGTIALGLLAGGVGAFVMLALGRPGRPTDVEGSDRIVDLAPTR